MKETISYHYNLEIDEIHDNGNYYSFEIGNNNYYFVFFNRTKEELEDLLKVCQELKQKNIAVHEIIYNRFYNILTKVGDLDYILFRIVGKKDETFDIINIIDFNNKLILSNDNSRLYRNNWGELWSKKIDYFEYQLSELGKGKLIVIDSFSYYVGLAENAITYVNRTNELYKEQKPKITLAHRRIFVPNTKLNYLNPLSFIFDLEVRDVAEYIKMTFFYGEDAFLELATYLKIQKLSNYNYHMLYARLLYPSYYFDVYEDIMNNGADEEKLLKIINKVDEYEEFLLKSYNEICKYQKIDEIDWIKKEL